MNRATPTKTNANMVRFLLVGVLALVLAYALYDALAGSPTNEAFTPFEQLADSANSHSSDVGEIELIKVPYHRLPAKPLDAALSHSPFEYDGTHARYQMNTRPEIEEVALESESADATVPKMMLPPDSSAEIILQTSRGRVAKVGGHLIREGTALGDGMFVHRIEVDRIFLTNEEDRVNDNDQDD